MAPVNNKIAWLMFAFFQIGMHVIRTPIIPMHVAKNLPFQGSFKNIQANNTTQIGIEKLTALTKAIGSVFKAVVKKNIDKPKIKALIP